ncbi:MAG: OsmC family peroxiredoxin [Acidobacteria bacterium]|nr:OsmC family peroxiredoxin [Acidobacteriota bacterium]
MVTQRTASSGPGAVNLLGGSSQPTFFALEEPRGPQVSRPEGSDAQRVRVWARSLSGMQKEAIVASSQPGPAWRLASDEGPYLSGFDAAPCPLAFMTVGMVSSYMDALHTAARQRGIDIGDVVLAQDNRYTMEGSALQGTMTGGALPVALDVRIGQAVDASLARDLVSEAVAASPVGGLQRQSHTSRFRLAVNGEPLALGRATPLPEQVSTQSDPRERFERVAPAAEADGGQVSRLAAVTPVAGVEGGLGSSLRAQQRRELHVRAVCRRRTGGVNEIRQELHSPLGSTFQFLSCDGAGEPGIAPDAVSYMAAGVAFCFMTQLGRFATIMKRELTGYRLVQDTTYVPGTPGHAGTVGAVDTHVFLDTPDGADFARHCLDMGEQTCFLHALYRTPLVPNITITRV